ncbi:hypothetical protein F5Y14DRAFT_433573 [Nemania sp. NC0429]|nr:hypothetical protein F5Y14DRAFT_433573 [Nemania sp. NC0429]
MDISTASDTDTNEDVTIASASNNSIHLKSVPAFVAWQSADGENRYLPDSDLALDYNANTQNALVKLRATTRLKKGPAKPSIFLFVKPDQINTLTCMSTDAEDSGYDKKLHKLARKKLGISIHILQFKLKSFL